MKIGIWIGFGMCCLACQQHGQQERITVNKTDSVTSRTNLVDTSPKAEGKDTLSLRMVDGKATAKTTIKPGEHVVFSFENTKLNTTIVLRVFTTVSGGNVRIGQIYQPDGKADGPFGMDATYTLSQLGTYHVVISENQMAGDPYDGPFTLEVQRVP